MNEEDTSTKDTADSQEVDSQEAVKKLPAKRVRGRQTRHVESQFKAKEKAAAKQALLYGIDTAVELIAIEREKALRKAIHMASTELEAKGEDRLSKRIGKSNVSRIPDDLLYEIDTRRAAAILESMNRIITQNIRSLNPLVMTSTREEKKEIEKKKKEISSDIDGDFDFLK